MTAVWDIAYNVMADPWIHKALVEEGHLEDFIRKNSVNSISQIRRKVPQ